MPDERVTLLYTSDLRPEVPRLATVLCSVLGVTMVDARRMARYGRGIFLENLDPVNAQALLPALKNMGIDCIPVPPSSILRPPKPVRCVLVDPTGDTLRYKISFQRDYEHIPWEAIRLLSVGIIATQQFRNAMTGSLAGALPVIYKVEDPEAKAELRDAIARKAGRRSVEPAEVPKDGPPALKHEILEKGEPAQGLTELQRKTRERFLRDELDTLYREQTDSYVDLFTIGMSGRYRISRRDFRFDYLGPRARPTSLENFKTLVEDLLFRIPQIEVPPMTEKYRHMTDVRDVVFDTLDEFDRYNTWVSHMSQLAEEGTPGVTRIAVRVTDRPAAPAPPVPSAKAPPAPAAQAPPAPAAPAPAAEAPPAP